MVHRPHIPRRRFAGVVLGLAVALALTGCGDDPADSVNSGSTEEDAPRSLLVTVTAYTSSRSQTDSTPYTTAFNEKIRPGDRIIAVSRDLEAMGLTHNTSVRIEGLDGVYRVADRTNKRWIRRIDLYFGNDRKAAKEWGKKKRRIWWPVDGDGPE